MIFRRRKYPLPKFPPSVASGFRAMCEALPLEQVPALKDAVEETMERVRTLAKEAMNVNDVVAEQVANRCTKLIETYPTLTEEQRAFAVGAIRYFVNSDAAPDIGFAAGFSDDVSVMNHVLEELGLMSDAIVMS